MTEQSPKKPGQDDKQRRLAEALRANLRRRKAQAKVRSGKTPEGGRGGETGSSDTER